MKMTITELNNIVRDGKDKIVNYQIKALMVRNGNIGVTPDERERLNEIINGDVKWWYNTVFQDLKPMMFDKINDIPTDFIDGTNTSILWVPLCTTSKGSFVR
jgi:hypothetical protein